MKIKSENIEKMKGFNVHLTVAEWRQLKIYAALQDLSMKGIVEQITRNFLKKIKKE